MCVMDVKGMEKTLLAGLEQEFDDFDSFDVMIVPDEEYDRVVCVEIWCYSEIRPEFNDMSVDFNFAYDEYDDEANAERLLAKACLEINRSMRRVRS